MIKRIHVTYHLKLDPANRVTAERHGREMKDIGSVEFQPRSKSISSALMNMLNKIRKST